MIRSTQKSLQKTDLRFKHNITNGLVLGLNKTLGERFKTYMVN